VELLKIVNQVKRVSAIDVSKSCRAPQFGGVHRDGLGKWDEVILVEGQLLRIEVRLGGIDKSSCASVSFVSAEGELLKCSEDKRGGPVCCCRSATKEARHEYRGK